MYIARSQNPDLDKEAIIQSYRRYMDFSQGSSPTQRQFILNIEAKMEDSEFLGDTKAILKPNSLFDQRLAMN